VLDSTQSARIKIVVLMFIFLKVRFLVIQI